MYSRRVRTSAASFFEEFKKSKAHLLNPNMITYIDNLLDGFDDTMADMDPIALTELEASNVEINSIVNFGGVLGHGKYGTVKRGILKSSGEEVAIKIICKMDLTEKDLACLKVIHSVSA